MEAIYDRIGIGYDATRRADPGIVARLRHHLGADDAGAYLDVGCGTGNYTIALAQSGIRMTGIDASAVMLDEARRKAAGVARLSWCQADVAKLPFADGQFAGALCTLAIQHFPDLGAAMAEVARVLDPGTGRLVLLTATPEQMARYWLNRYFPAMLARSIRQMPALGDVRAALGAAGLAITETEPFFVTPALQDLFLYSGKQRPELYLDPRFRAGISSFANLAKADETERGLAALAEDIDTGPIGEIIASADHDGGDCLFVAASRRNDGVLGI